MAETTQNATLYQNWRGVTPLWSMSTEYKNAMLRL